ncbi:DUF3243 domain-containing protein [Bacillus sp. V59.32b]|uniref:DUF3243 domain-containing protein n=1 Tax=Bacillus sp. V59.32b TaxID=1758642 RepID=UPI000E3D9033|nr:DUF3243 domain-containing protein [Bacillus sp. V59.32b]RFU60078.1 DUF3243 domain-containing protein [Bacillus sp. V59.32b]
MENSFNSNNTANEGNVEEKLQSIGEEKKDEVLSSFETFKSYLSDKVSKGESMGMNEEQLAKTAQKVADYLADHEEPRNREEKLLQELWKSGNEEEQHKLAHMLVKMVQ